MDAKTDHPAPGIQAEGSEPALQPLRTPYRHYCLTILLLAFIMNFVDRRIVTILAEPIKNDLHLADWQIGATTGLAFALFYSGLGIPIARLAARFHRPRLIATCMSLWSLFTMLCGSATGFLSLLFMRMGVGVGEAGCTPTAHSLITDYVPREKRASSLAFYSLGVPLGTLVGLGLGGIIADAVGWRATFLFAGAPGLLLAVIAFLTLKEPRAGAGVGSEYKSLAFGPALRELARKRSFWLVSFAAAGTAFSGDAQSTFIAPFYMRVHGEELATLAAAFGLKPIGFLGLALGLVQGLAGLAGTVSGGALADRLGRHDVRAYAVLPTCSSLIAIPFYLALFSADSLALALVFNGMGFFLCSMWYGPVYGIVQSVASPSNRATATAIMMVIISVLGIGCGPLVMGIVSDLASTVGNLGPAEGLRWALFASPIGLLIAGPLFFAARRYVRQDIVG
jgi:predicted MFS family arabinose efflux permease